MVETTEQSLFYLQDLKNWNKSNTPVLIEQLGFSGLDQEKMAIAQQALEKFIDSLNAGINTTFLKVLAQKEIRTALAAV